MLALLLFYIKSYLKHEDMRKKELPQFSTATVLFLFMHMTYLIVEWLPV